MAESDQMAAIGTPWCGLGPHANDAVTRRYDHQVGMAHFIRGAVAHHHPERNERLGVENFEQIALEPDQGSLQVQAELDLP